MICLRSGYCCKALCVVIVDDPALGPVEDNLIIKTSGERCKHFRGDKAGEYSCAIHEESWYPETPCGTHGQIEHGNTRCRMGNYILNDIVMIDIVTRQVERSPDPRGQAQALNLRIRSGELTGNRVELAAQLGEVRSRLIYPQAVQVDWTKWRQRCDIIKASSEALDFTLPARVAADWAEHVLMPGDGVSAKAIAAARAWAKCPCESCSDVAYEAAEAVDVFSSVANAAGAVSVSAASAYSATVSATAAAIVVTTDSAAVAADAARNASSAAWSGEGPAVNNRIEQEWQCLRLAAYLLGEAQ